jgi:molybdopterin-guanine dinucleotide biosynthesis protein A
VTRIDERLAAGDVAAVVLAGGAGRRMGGVDKPGLVVGGTSLLDRVLGAARPVCQDLIVVGPARATEVPNPVFTQEPEPGGGPVPAVLAGLGATDASILLVLAADLPLVTTHDLSRLVAELADRPDTDVAAALDDRPGPNPLLAAYRRSALDRVAATERGPGTPAAALLSGSVVEVGLGSWATFNVNRPADLDRARTLLGAP